MDATIINSSIVSNYIHLGGGTYMSSDNKKLKLIRAGKLIDGKSGQIVKNAALLIDGSTITAVGPEAKISPSNHTQFQEFNYPNATMLPGLVDAHIHMNGFGDGRLGDELSQYPSEILMLQSAKNLRKHLKSGVTTIRDCGSKQKTAFHMKEGIRLGLATGPRMIVCGRPITITGGHMWYFGSEANGESDVVSMVRQLVKEGADFIKIVATGGSTVTSFTHRASFNPNEMLAMVNEAHKFGKLTGAHCISSQGVINALDAGVDTIIHCGFFEPDGSSKFKPEVAKRIADTGTWVDATVAQSWVRQLAIEKKEERGEQLSSEDKVQISAIKESRLIHQDHFGRMLDLGVRMVSGSDSSWAHYPIGGFQYEIIGHAEWGMNNMDAIISGTKAAADCIGLGNIVGTLEPGKEADILLVDGDPSVDIWDLLKVKDVFLAGEKV